MRNKSISSFCDLVVHLFSINTGPHPSPNHCRGSTPRLQITSAVMCQLVSALCPLRHISRTPRVVVSPAISLTLSHHPYCDLVGAWASLISCHPDQALPLACLVSPPGLPHDCSLSPPDLRPQPELSSAAGHLTYCSSCGFRLSASQPPLMPRAPSCSQLAIRRPPLRSGLSPCSSSLTCSWSRPLLKWLRQMAPLHPLARVKT